MREVSVWFETNRYRAEDGLVHIVVMKTFGGLDGTTKFHQCRPAQVEEVGAETPITCLICLSYKED
jgi:hypothetical protein